MYPKRILHITSVLNFGGIETFIMNIFRNIDRAKIVFDFLVVSEDEGFFEEEIHALGGKIYKIPSLKKCGYFRFKKSLDSFFKEHKEYEIVHSHINAFSSIVLNVAKDNGIKTRIAHSHTAFPKYSFFERIIKNHFRSKITESSTDFFACSKNASDWLFGKGFSKSIIIKNLVDQKLFAFSENSRKKIRKELKLNNDMVIINVSRFSKEKNHSFLISVFKELLLIYPNSQLIFIGDGKEKDKIENKAKKSSISEKVIFLPAQKNVYDFMSAADIFVSTSSFEGFGSSAAEAQYNSLPCILSDAHPPEVSYSENCIFMSLDEPKDEWAKTIVNTYKKSLSSRCSEVSFEDNIHQTVDFLTNFYINK